MDAGSGAGLAMLAVIVACLLAGVAVPFLPRRFRRRSGGVAAGVLGGIDEVWHPTAYDAQLLRLAQTETPAPAPLAGDPPWFDGERIVVELPVTPPAGTGPTRRPRPDPPTPA